jgi:hypothetical protein
MQREIKFRGLHSFNGKSEWVYGYYFKHPYDDTHSIFLMDGRGSRVVDKETIGDFTGLKDSKGVEIYEGDVLYIEDDYGKYGWAAGSTVKVIFKTGRFIMEDNAGRYYFDTESDIQDGVTIQGNVYQHPHLIS